MLSQAARYIPSSLNRFAGVAYIHTQTALDRNRYTYELDNNTVCFEYRNIEEFLFFRDLIADRTIIHDEVDTAIFDFDRDFDAFIDIGAHFGTYSAIVGMLNPGMEIYCFEPNEYNRETLTHTMAINGIEATISGEVVSGTTGELSFYEKTGEGALGHSTTDVDQAVETTKQSVALSDIIDRAGLERPFLKIDAEGEEAKIVRDFLANTSLDFVAGIVSVHPDKLNTGESEKGIVSLLEDYGYTCEFLDDSSKPDDPPRPEYYFTI
jgi:FkbM family methyltransferase